MGGPVLAGTIGIGRCHTPLRADNGRRRRAAKGTRTLDSLLGKQRLYQLSYRRVWFANPEKILAGFSEFYRAPPRLTAEIFRTAIESRFCLQRPVLLTGFTGSNQDDILILTAATQAANPFTSLG